MGTDSFKCLNTPEIFSFQFVIETVTIFDGENQNFDPLSRYELVEVPNVLEGEHNVAQPKPQAKESRPGKFHLNLQNMSTSGFEGVGAFLPRDGKKKGKGKSKSKGKKDKKKAKDKGAKKKTPKKPVPVEKPAMVTKRKHIYLPPLRLVLRYFFNRTVNVDQIDLPDVFGEEVEQHKDTKPIDNLAFDKGKKGKGKTGKKGKRDKRGKKQKDKKKKAKEAKPQVIPREPSIEWVSDDYYSPEELSWRIPAEESFKRALTITFPATCEQMIFWLQRGPIKTSVYRWKGYGENIAIGTANLSFDPSPFIEMVVKRGQKLDLGTVSCRAEDIADIVNPLGEKIGEIAAYFFLICSGGTVISELLISEKGVFDVLGEEAEKKNDSCESCGKFGFNYGYERLEDQTIAVVPNSVIFDNSPFMTTNKYREYAEALFEILSSHNPVSDFGQYIEKVAATGISPDDIIV